MRREIRTYIQRQIAQGVYRPGDRIVETQLAREMNVSQAPVREALLELAAMGLVEERPYSGTFVRHLKASDIEDIYKTRAFLDEYAARQAARLATQEQLDAMEVLLKKMDQAEDDASFAEMDIAFHGMIVDAADSPSLKRAWDNLRLVEWTSVSVAVTQESLPELAEQHWQIFRTLRSRIAKVTGTAQYGSDVDLPGQLYAAVARSPYPHARILQINTQEAAALSGVRAVITGADCPTLFGSFIADQPIVAREKVRYQGEPVAAVAADTQEIAREAARLIQVEYEQLPVVNDLETSMKNEVLVHEDWSQYDCSSACFPVQGTNIGDQYHLKKGDVEAGFAQADEIVESDFTCGMLQHTTIETHTATAQADPISGEIHIWVPAQSPFSNRGLIAKTFHVPMEKVRLTVTEIGGGFGGKYEAKCEPIAVALSLKAKGRPVKLTYGRDEEFAATVCRSPVHIHMKTGVKRDGTLTAQKVEIQWDAGAYVTTNPRVDYNAGFAANGPYKIPNAQVDAYVYMTNKTLGTAYRGFGVTEVATAHERQMAEMGQGVTTTLPQIAAETLGMALEKISMAPVDTAITPYDKTTTSSRSTFHSGNAVLEACEDIKKQLCRLAAIKFGVAPEDVTYTADGYIQGRSRPEQRIHINDVGTSGILHEQPPVVAVGRYGTSDIFDPPPVDGRQSKRPTVMWMHGAQAAVVAVNPKTGRVHVKKVGAAHDVGKAINPTGCLQQIEGSIIMGLGHALMEEMIYEDGKLRNGNMVDQGGGHQEHSRPAGTYL